MVAEEQQPAIAVVARSNKPALVRSTKGQRTCAGCGEKLPREGSHAGGEEPVVRFIANDGGMLAVDASGRLGGGRGGLFGRGATVHARNECLRSAAQRGLAKSFRRRLYVAAPVDAVEGEPSLVPLTVDGLAALLGEAAHHRMEGLLGAARGAGACAVGRDSVAAAFKKQAGRCLIVVAHDASILKSVQASLGTAMPAEGAPAKAAPAEAADEGMAAAIAAGQALAFGTKDQLAAALGRDGEVAVAAIVDTRFWDAMRGAVRMIEMARNLGWDGALRRDEPATPLASDVGQKAELERRTAAVEQSA